jgi:glycosyltransferase involved in cell wall biosynthesis
MTVVHFQRATGVGVSIERLFDHVRSAFPKDIEVEVKCLPHSGTNPIRLLQNMWFAFLNQGELNHITGACYYIALAMNPRKTILTIHDCANLHKLRGIRRKIFKLLWYDLPCRWVKKITVISEFSKRELLELVRIPADKIEVVNNCVDPSFIPVNAPDHKDSFVFLQIGTKANKNVGRIAEALTGVSCRLRIVGSLSCEQKAILDKFHIDYSNVFRISDAELREEYARANALLFVSTYEGFGLPIIEAQAVGRPVVTSALEPMREVAGQAGALLVNPHHVGEIQEAVRRVLNGDIEQTVERGFENVERFRASIVATEYLAVYEEVLGCED